MRALIILLITSNTLLGASLTERGWLESTHSSEHRVVIGGPVIELLEHGRRVKAGEVIAKQDNSSALKAIDNIEENLIELQSELTSAQNEFEIKMNELEEEQKMNQANLKLAQARLKEAKEKPDAKDFRLSQIDLELAQIELDRARENYDRQERMVNKGFGSPRSLRTLDIRVKGREQNLRIQKSAHEQLQLGSSEELLIELESEVTKWKDLIKRHNKRKKMQLDSQKLGIKRIKEQQSTKEIELAYQKDLLSRSIVKAKEDGLLLYVMRRDWSSGGKLRPIKVGDHLWGADRIANIIDPSKVNVVVAVHESNLTRIRMGSKVSVTFPALPNLSSLGSVVSVSMMARDLSEILPQGYLDGDHGQSYFKVVISLDEQNDRFKPGMTASVTFVKGK